MDKKEIEQIISDEMQKRRGRVINKNAFEALFQLPANPLGSLSKILLGRKDAIDSEARDVKLEIILNILCKIDDSLEKTREKGIAQAEIITIVSGEIEAHGYATDEVIGVLVSSDAGITEFKPGTHIKVSGTESKKVIGLQIGNGPKPKGD